MRSIYKKYKDSAMAWALVVLTLTVPVVSIARVFYTGTAGLATGDIRTAHIFNNDLLDIDVSSSTKIMGLKLNQEDFELDRFQDRGILSTTGTLTVARGGTGLTTGLAGGVVYYESTGVVTSTNDGASGQVLKNNGAGTEPTWQSDSGGGSCRAHIPKPYMGIDTLGTTPVSQGTLAGFAKFNLPCSMTVDRVSFDVTAVSVAGAMQFGIFTDDGQTRVMVSTTESIINTGIFTASTTPFVMNPGDYYLMYVDVGTTNITLRSWGALGVTAYMLQDQGQIDDLRGWATVTDGTIPTSFTLSGNTAAGTVAAVFRLDDMP